ncbi:hypothetical protein GCM10009541_36820 [Micromonospora gifhornensis]|uniref:Uncharacterized protein n=1 Tax=Micromonospora gifhornensis TaxID=84594 RepID=A0ABQ4IMU2_9ACTN|nr:hypothetical protein Vgi01_59130 [Micromonospora gifhornensis]
MLAGRDNPPIDGTTADIAWLLRQTGHRDEAVDFAEHGLANLRTEFDGRKVIYATESVQLLDMIKVAHIRLVALLLMDAIDRGAEDQAGELVEELTTLDVSGVRPDCWAEAACAVALAFRRFPAPAGPSSDRASGGHRVCSDGCARRRGGSALVRSGWAAACGVAGG